MTDIRFTNYKFPTCLDVVSNLLTGVMDEFKNQINKDDLIKKIKSELRNSNYNCNNITCPTCSCTTQSQNQPQNQSQNQPQNQPQNQSQNQPQQNNCEEKIHPHINQIGLDESLITNINDIITDVLSPSNYFPNIQVNSDADLEKYLVINKQQVLPGKINDIFSEPKQVITDFTSNLFFTSEEKYYIFISKFIKFMETLINEYCNKNQSNLNKKFPGCEKINDKIIFVFKGGNLLKGYFQKFLNEQPGIVTEYITQKYSKYFKNSDLDFQIIIHPRLHSDKNTRKDIYEYIYNDMLKLSYIALNRWRNYMLSDISEIINFYELNSNIKKKILTKCKNKINSASIFDTKLMDENGVQIGDINAKKQYQKDNYGQDADIFVGANIENLQFYNINTRQDVYDEYLANKNNPTFLKQRDTAHPEYDIIIDRMNNNKEDHLELFPRTDFYITTRQYNGIIYTLSQKLYKSKLLIDEKVQNKIYPNADIRSEFYITVNNYVKFKTRDNNNAFGLARMKFNTIGYIKFLDGTRGMLNIPGEFIDISISKLDDMKQMNKFQNNTPLIQYFNRYTFINHNQNINITNFNFWSYNLHGFISDLYDIIYFEYIYPWEDIKYKKRLDRIFIFSLFEILFLKNTKENLDIFMNKQTPIKIQNLFSLDYNDPQINSLVDEILLLLNKSEIRELIFYKIIENHKKIANLLIAEADPIIKKKYISEFDNYKIKCRENFLTFQFVFKQINNYINNDTIGHINNDRMGKLHQLGGYYKEKYLKYKKKYIKNSQLNN
jgi:hypothetical protein